MGFTTKECAWAQVNVKLLGNTIVGLRGFEFKKGIDKEHLYAAGPDPIAIQSGNKKPEGNLKVLKFELDKLNEAAQVAGYADILEVPGELILITTSFRSSPTAPMFICEAIGVEFSEWTVGQEQNAKFTEVTLPFLALKVTSRKA